MIMNSDAKKIPFIRLGLLWARDLENIKYHQLLEYCMPFQSPENAFRLICGDFVTTSDRTVNCTHCSNIWS